MRILTPSQMRLAEQEAINEYKIPGIILMENAAIQAAEVIKDRYPLPQYSRVLIAAGCGNNGGDGFAIARHLYLSGYRITVLLIHNRGKVPIGDAAANLRILEKLSVDSPDLDILWLSADVNHLSQSVSQLITSASFIVDSLFGTGLDRPVTGMYYDIIEGINNARKPVIAVDIPSGINGTTGKVEGIAVKATETVTFGYAKPGQLLFPGREYTGKLQIKPISLPLIEGAPDNSDHLTNPDQLINPLEAEKSDSIVTNLTFFTLTDEEIVQRLKPRPRDSHKGTFGKVAVIAGSTGLTGAAYLSSISALRSGAGLVTLGIPSSLNLIMEEKLTEAMTFLLEDRGHGHLIPESMDDVLELLKDKHVLAIGPGLGKDSGVFEIIRNIFGKINISIVIDADGLNHISKDISLLRSHQSAVIITPHPGEMSRLTGKTIGYILENPVDVAVEFAKECNVIVLLKGAATIVADPNGKVYINSSGNSGMAKGGSGDILTGIIASFIAQGYEPYDAAVYGCYIHGRAGDEAASDLGEVGMIAGDIVDALPKVLKKLVSNS